METQLNHIFYPATYNELFLAWSRFPDAVLYAGGVDINLNRSGWADIWQGSSVMPAFLCLDNLEELHQITRTEQYLEIGAMIKLNKLLRLGKMVPEILRMCIENIAGVQVRNLASIGGNICCTSRLLDLPALLTSLDAQYELRSSSGGIRWVSAARFHSKEEHTGIEKHEILTRIRLSLHQWDYSVYKKFRGEGPFHGNALVFLAKTQKNILSDIKVIYKSDKLIRNKNGEDILSGKNLPLSRKTADDFIENWKKFLAENREIGGFSANTLINSIEENVYNLSE
ncbi:MAG: FAD binding domain-containing protein [Treponema sp.]|nr:FAD binding domain-containing protein [Treponema sp.]